MFSLSNRLRAIFRNSPVASSTKKSRGPRRAECSTRNAARCFAEGLEPRVLLAAQLSPGNLALSFGTSGAIIDGVTRQSPLDTTAIFSLDAAISAASGFGPEPTGTLTLQWYGGGVVAVVPVNNSTVSLETPVPITLSSADDGTPVASSGSYAGFHVLFVSYSGDANYLPTGAFGAAEFSQLQSGDPPTLTNYYYLAFFATKSLSVITGASNTAAGDVMRPPVKVAILDPTGSVDTTASATITVAIASTSTGQGSLSGTTSEPTVDGVATFGNLSVNSPGQYSFSFADTSGDTTASGLFDITGGKLVFLKQPTSGSTDSPLNPTVEVALKNGKGKILTDSTDTVSLSIYGTNSTNPITGNAVELVDGVATFSDLTLGQPGFYKLQATDDEGDTDVLSGKFKIAGDKLVFVKQPGNSNVDTPLPLTVKILNAEGHIDAGATSSIALSLTTIAGTNTAVLSGTLVLPFVAGMAAFMPTINVKGTFKLTATDEDDSTGSLAPSADVTAITTKQFSLDADFLKFIEQPEDADVLRQLPLKIELVDKHGYVATMANSTQVQLKLNTVKDGTGAQLLGPVTADFVNGIAEFVPTPVDFADDNPIFGAPFVTAGGTYTLEASEIGTANPNAPGESRKFESTGFKLTAFAFTGGITLAKEGLIALNTDLDFVDLDQANSETDRFSIWPQDSKGAFLHLGAISPDDPPGDTSAGVPGHYPTMKLTSVTLEGDGSVTTVAPFTVNDQQPTDLGSSIFRPGWNFARIASAKGTYRITVAPNSLYQNPDPDPTIPMGLGGFIPLESFDPVSIEVKAYTPALHAQLGSTAEPNQPFTINALLNEGQVKSYTPNSSLPPLGSVGFSVTLISGPQGGSIGGTTAAPAGTALEPVLTVSGVYKLLVTEVITPNFTLFDPNNFSTVPTTVPVILTVHV